MEGCPIGLGVVNSVGRGSVVATVVGYVTVGNGSDLRGGYVGAGCSGVCGDGYIGTVTPNGCGDGLGVCCIGLGVCCIGLGICCVGLGVGNLVGASQLFTL